MVHISNFSRVELMCQIESVLLGDPFHFLTNFPPSRLARWNINFEVTKKKEWKPFNWSKTLSRKLPDCNILASLCRKVSRFEEEECSLKITWYTGLWPFWKSQLPALLFAAEAEAGRLLPKPVKEGAEWEQIGKERPYPLEPDPWCSEGKNSCCKKILLKIFQKPGPYCEEEHTDGRGGDEAKACKDGKITSLVGRTTKPYSLCSQRDCQMISLPLDNIIWQSCQMILLPLMLLPADHSLKYWPKWNMQLIKILMLPLWNIPFIMMSF